MTVEIRGGIELPARRDDIALETADGLTLVGELALPIGCEPVATLVTFHPLPTAGGFMDSHVLRKAAARLPALADIAVLRFNFRGVTSPRGRSGGEFGHGVDERYDVDAAMAFIGSRSLPSPWMVGWSFGTDMVLKYGRRHSSAGVILLSPPLRSTSPAELAAWSDYDRPLVALVPEFDDFLRPEAAAERFSVLPNLELVAVQGGKHLWVGEEQTYRVLTEIVARANSAALPLRREWDESLP